MSLNSIFLIPGFFSFSFIASAIYILNDYRDIELERNHPEKHNRPLASGAIGMPTAIIAMFIFVTIDFGIAFLINIVFFVIVVLYFILNVGYSLELKNISIIDILIVATGFLLRIIAGGIIVGVPISQWLILMVFLLSLFLALAKRRDDILIFPDSGQKMRTSIQNFNVLNDSSSPTKVLYNDTLIIFQF